jgi:hypothetical protein
MTTEGDTDVWLIILRPMQPCLTMQISQLLVSIFFIHSHYKIIRRLADLDLLPHTISQLC